VGRTAIEGDTQVDLVYHGGEDMAVYAYSADNWDWWQGKMKLTCRPGLFGENLTLRGADEKSVRIGDRFAWGDVVLEVSQPRVPCFKLSIHTDRADVPAAMTLSGRCGWYCRVLKEGSAPSVGTLTQSVGVEEGPTIHEAFTAVFGAKPDIMRLQKIKVAPRLAKAWQRQVDKKIASVML
jgi:MOSC domain-containing protein YiiM